MKVLATTFLSFFSATLLFAQVPTSATESTDRNILYLGYKNKVKIATNAGESSMFRVTATNCTAAPTDIPYEYIVTPSNGDMATLSVYYVGKDGNATHIEKMEYLIQTLPQVSIYWGNAKAGDKASLKDKDLSVKYVSGVPFEANFSILRWEITSDFGNADGHGTDLTPATALFEEVDTTTTISMTLDVRSSDGITRKIGATWTVNPLESSDD